MKDKRAPLKTASRPFIDLTMLRPDKTRIVAAIGLASSSPAALKQMIRAGMNVARPNFSHGEFDSHRRKIGNSCGTHTTAIR